MTGFRMHANTMRHPRLTMLTVVHNGERYLDEAIASVLAQDYTDYEYLIVDDGSTDGTRQILQRWADRDPRIAIAHLLSRGGIARALNHGLALARGEYIGRQDADDICVGARLRRQVELLDREPDVVLVSANYTLIDHRGGWEGRRIVENPSALFPYLLNFTNPMLGAGSQGMFRRDAARELGGFCEDIEASVDYEFWTRLLARGRAAILPFVGLKCRLHRRQTSVTRREEQRRNYHAISRRMLAAYLGRELADDEFGAVISIWEQDGQTVDAAIGNGVLHEAYARFAAEADPALRRRLRLITAGQWALSSVALARKREFAAAARHFGYAMTWHPAGLCVAAAFVAERLFVRGRRGISSALHRP